MTGAPFAYEVPDDAPPDLQATALLGAGLAELRDMFTDLAEQHFALREQVDAQRRQDAASPGAPTVLRWAELDRPGATALWLWLIDWVRWLNHRFGLAADLPPCWPAHPPMVEELTALAAAWHASYDARAHPEAPLRWLESFARCRVRLRAWDAARCRNGIHTPPTTELDWPATWRATALDTAEADLTGRPTPTSPAPAGTTSARSTPAAPAADTTPDGGAEPP